MSTLKQMTLLVDEVERLDHRPERYAETAPDRGHAMASTPSSALTGRTLRGFATRRPEWFAVLTILASVLPQLASRLLAPQAASAAATWNPVQFAGLVWTVLVPTVLLIVWGWWGVAGFTRRFTWRSLLPFLPLILLYVVPIVVVAALFVETDHSLGNFALVAVGALAVGFGDEALFRGVVLQTLLPGGTRRAVILSSALWGAQYFGTMAAGVDPVLVGVQAVHMVGIGIAFAAVVVVTGTIWPLVLIDATMQLPYFLIPEAASRPDLASVAMVAGVGALTAAYGIWLLHRHQHRHG